MHKVQWNFKNSLLEPGKINEFSKACSLPYVFATVLMNRGIKTQDDLRKYIGKSLENINNPMLLPDMEKAVPRIIKAVEQKEKIVIYGDYDVDGITSTALLYTFLESLGADVSYYIPDRIEEGYGLNIMAVNKIAKQGTKLMITVDCGVASIGEVELAKVLKMDVIITDHHNCRERLPDALAVVNPKRADSKYPFNALAGVGVAFKLVLALGMKLGMSTRDCFAKYVELAAIGTIADVVDLTDENRIIVDKGLKKLSKCSNVGIKTLLEVCGVQNKPINSTTVAFMISPRINAAGRMKNAGIALNLLLSKSPEEAYENALKLDEVNRERQKVEEKIFNEVIEMIESDESSSQKKVIVLAKEGWHHGVIGIVASKVVDLYYKPCILIAVENGKGKGSGRSVEGINLFDALTYCEDDLSQYGGHAMAAGLSLNMSEFDKFCDDINKFVKDTVKEEPQQSIDIDCSVTPEFISIQNAKQLEYFEPYGMCNEKPVFALCGVEVISAKTMGINNKHLRLMVDAGGKTIEAVGFSFGEYAKYLTPKRKIDIAFNIDINSFGGKERVQLILKDLKSAQN